MQGEGAASGPAELPLRSQAAEDLGGFLRSYPRLFVLTGAGVSTGSGIPDYRGVDGRWKRRPPMHLPEFARGLQARRRYWARAMLGWPRFAGARPGPAHGALVELENRGFIHHLVTQNVDGLHQRAGSRRVLDLHGRLDEVECLGCPHRQGRETFQRELERRNPGFLGLDVTTAPDGDADVEDASFGAFDLPDCPSCGGILKPAVVFFGEAVPRSRVEQAFSLLDEANAVLVVGSSLMVWSGYRFVRRAVDTGKPVAAINLGQTRADGELAMKVEADCGRALVGLLEGLD